MNYAFKLLAGVTATIGSLNAAAQKQPAQKPKLVAVSHYKQAGLPDAQSAEVFELYEQTNGKTGGERKGFEVILENGRTMVTYRVTGAKDTVARIECFTGNGKCVFGKPEKTMPMKAMLDASRRQLIAEAQTPDGIANVIDLLAEKTKACGAAPEPQYL